jgi:sporulation protein YlmC with PRC-barrel domain
MDQVFRHHELDGSLKMDIPIHANVTCHDGAVGKSTHIIVDLVTEKVTHFVVKTDHDHKEFVMPIEMIADSDRTVILLNCRKEDVYQLPLFKQGEYNGYDAYDSAPPIPSSTMYHPYRTAEGGVAEEQHAVELAVSKGVRVLATDGEVGKIDEFVIDPETHRVTHLVLRQHNIFGKWIVTIPVTEIERADMDFVELKLDKAAIEELPAVALKRFPWEV